MPTKLPNIIGDPLIYLDMDGVVADFAGYIKKHSGQSIEQQGDDQMWKWVWEQEEQGTRVWESLDKMPDADKLYKYVKQFNHEVLTSTGSRNPAVVAKQKKKWFNRHFSYAKVNTTTSSKAKGGYAAPNHILIDDWYKSIEAFESAGGVGILHTSAASTIRQLQKLGL